MILPPFELTPAGKDARLLSAIYDRIERAPYGDLLTFNCNSLNAASRLNICLTARYACAPDFALEIDCVVFRHGVYTVRVTKIGREETIPLDTLQIDLIPDGCGYVWAVSEPYTGNELIAGDAPHFADAKVCGLLAANAIRLGKLSREKLLGIAPDDDDMLSAAVRS